MSKIALVILLLCSTGSLFAQNQVQITAFNINAPYSNLISDYITQFNQRVTLMVNATGKTDIRLAGTLKSNTGVSITIPAQLNVIQPFLSQPITIQGPQRITVAQIGNLFSSDPSRDNSTIALKRGLTNQPILPEGDYEVCIRAYEFNGSRALSDEVCTSFSIRNIEPPYLLLPQDKDTLQTATATYQPHQFSWTFPAGANPTQIEYVLQIAELRQGQNPYNVFETGPLFAEIVVSNASPLYILKATDPRFELGHTYAWRVKVQGKGRFEGLVNFQNKGLSTVNVFTYGPIKTTSGDNLVTSSEKVVGTKKKADSSAVSFTPISGSCTCKITVSTNTKLKTDLDNSQTVYIGNKEGYQLSISRLEKTGDTYTGDGTVALALDFTPTGRSGPFIPLQVAFKDVKINTDNILIAGQVRSKKREGISFGPQLAADPTTPNAPNLPSGSDLKTWLLKSADEKSLAPAWKGLKEKIAGEYESYKQQAVQQANQQINGAGVATPFGYSSGVFTVAVDNIVFTPTTAQYDAFSVLEVNDLNVSVPLGLMGACLPMAGCQSQPVLYLLRDTDIPYTAQTLSLKGGTDPTNSTYLAYKASGNDNVLNIVADVTIPGATLVDGGAPVKARLVANTKDGFDNWQAKASIAGAFRFKSLADFTFKLGSGAVYDHDIDRNADGFDAALQSLQTGLMADKVPNADTKLALLRETAWQGFFMPELSITLPGVFQKTNADGKTTTTTNVTVRNMMLGKSLGLTGVLNAENVINYKDGSLDGWFFSLDKIGITFFDGTFVKANADGKIGLPISETSTASALVYTNTLSPNAMTGKLEYLFSIKPNGNINVPVWKAIMTLDEASAISVSVAAGEVLAKAELNGNLSFDVGAAATDVAGLPVPSLKLDLFKFEQLKIQSRGPKYIDLGSLSSPVYQKGKEAIDGYAKFAGFVAKFASPQKNVSGFPFTIDRFEPIMAPDGRVGFAFAGGLEMTDIPLKPVAKVGLSILAKVTMKGGRPTFAFDNVYLDKVQIAGEMGPVKIEGELDFYRGDKTFGDGFKGNIKGTFPPNINVGVTAQFGHRDDFDYWYVYANAIGFSVPIIPPVPIFITGFGGGAYYNMTGGTDKNLAIKVNKEAPAPIPDYKPAKGQIGLKAGIYGSVVEDRVLKAQAFLGVEWGDRFRITLDGVAQLINTNAAPVKNSGMMNGSVHMEYDASQNTFLLDGSVEASLADVITMKANDNIHVRAGNGHYFLKIGEPDNRVKVDIARLATAGAYFMVGTDIGDIPAPDVPADVLAKLRYVKPKGASGEMGSGVAFGASVNVGASLDLAVVEVGYKAGLGADINLRNGGTDALCDGHIPGYNGWYAQGQAYGYLKGWVKVPLLGSATFGLYANIRAGLPNPSWMDAIVACENPIYDFDLPIQLGDNKCVVKTNPFNKPDLISSVSIPAGDGGVSIFETPTITLNYPLAFDVDAFDEKENPIIEHYTLEVVASYGNGKDETVSTKTTGQDVLVTDSQLLYWKKAAAFSPKRNYSLTVTAKTFVKRAGKPIQEFVWHGTALAQEKKIDFTTGAMPDNLAPNMDWQMPFAGQKYVLPGELRRGSLTMIQSINFADYEVNGTDKPVMLLTDEATKKVTEISTQISGSGITYTMPPLANKATYTLQLVLRGTQLKKQIDLSKTTYNKLLTAKNNPTILPGLATQNSVQIVGAAQTAGGSQFAEARKESVQTMAVMQFERVDKILYSYRFRTSEYNTFQAKATAYEHSFGAQAGDPYNALITLGDEDDREPLDEFDTRPHGKDRQIKPLWSLSAEPNNSRYFKEKVAVYERNLGGSEVLKFQVLDPSWRDFRFNSAIRADYTDRYDQSDLSSPVAASTKASYTPGSAGTIPSLSKGGAAMGISKTQPMRGVQFWYSLESVRANVQVLAQEMNRIWAGKVDLSRHYHSQTGFNSCFSTKSNEVSACIERFKTWGAGRYGLPMVYYFFEGDRHPAINIYLNDFGKTDPTPFDYDETAVRFTFHGEYMGSSLTDKVIPFRLVN